MNWKKTMELYKTKNQKYYIKNNFLIRTSELYEYILIKKHKKMLIETS